jgi:Domain of Unknown Function (DUF748)
MPNFMTPLTFRFAKWIGGIVIGFALLLVLTGAILSRYASKAVQSRIEAFGGKIGDLNVNLFTRGISISKLEFNLASDSSYHLPTSGHVETILLKNIDIYQILFNKKLNIKEILIEDGDIQYNRKVSLTDSTETQNKNPLKGIFVEHLNFRDINLSIVSDSSKEFSGTLDVTLNKIQSSDTSDVSDLKAYMLENIEAKITKFLVFTGKLYEMEIKSIHVNSEKKKLVVDSLTLIPKYPKYKFSHVAGKQIDRINTFIRKIEVSGLRYNQLRDSAFLASNIQILSGEVYSFRDKRMAFKETKNKPLPMAALKQMGFGIEVDTIQIRNSKITYEEFAPEGFEGGKITFEDLNATMTNLSNRSYYNKPDHASLKASARLMGQGLIEASFQLPFEQDKSYHAEGKIGKLALHHLNPPLENLAFINIESGTLNEMNFSFDYTDKSSNGKLTINYENLKINGLKKEKTSVINELKTLLINTVVKNDKDKSVPTERRTGTIEFERDRKRQVFNFWWKSLFSGIKSSVLEN